MCGCCFGASEAFRGSGIPVHVTSKHEVQAKLLCVRLMTTCAVNIEWSVRSVLTVFHCKHVRSIDYCSYPHTVDLEEDILTEMEQARWFVGSQKQQTVSEKPLLRCWWTRVSPPKSMNTFLLQMCLTTAGLEGLWSHITQITTRCSVLVPTSDCPVPTSTMQIDTF